MKFVEHRLRVHLEGLSEEIVKVDLVGFVNARDGNRAAVTWFAGARGSAHFFLFAVSLDHGACSSGHVDLLCVCPVLERGVVRDEGGRPLVGVVDHIFVYTVLEVFLLVCVEEKVKTREVTK